MMEEEAAFLLDGEGRCVEAGGGVAGIFGVSEGEMLRGEDLGRLLWPEGKVAASGDGIFVGRRFTYRQVGFGGGVLVRFDAAGEVDPEEGGISGEGDLRRELDALRTLHQASGILSSTLEVEEIGSKLLRLMRGVFGLTAAVIDTEDDEGRIRIWRASGLDSLWPKARFAAVAEEARRKTLQFGEIQTFEIHPPVDDAETPPTGVSTGDSVFALYVPLRVQEQVVGLLEAYGDEALEDPGTVGILGSLATQAASALENARLYREISDREARLEYLVGRLMSAQEEERRRVAYEVHDGLAQTAAAAHQHLQAYARLHGEETGRCRDALEGALRLVKRTVGEARRVIAHLRPTTLDDFGLQTALRMEIEELRAEGWDITFEGRLEEKERVSQEIETALFRVAQQAVNNIKKHAETRRARVVLSRFGDGIRLRVRDRGRGFDPVATLSPEAMKAAGRAGARVGVESMRERVTLLGGEFRLASRPGSGTLVSVAVPLPQGTVATQSLPITLPAASEESRI